MSGATAPLRIIVLHYRNLADTIECLNSIAAQTYANIRTILIDNGSNDSPLTDLAADYPWVELVTLAENLGWSGGNNVGIRAALAQGVDFVCLLNNDTVLPEQAVERLMATATTLGACLLHPAIDSYGVDDSVQLDPTIPEPAYLTVVPVPAVPDVYQISAVNGACLLVHRAVFAAIGLIDERFFLLCEDADFARRRRRAHSAQRIPGVWRAAPADQNLLRIS
jgi:GT2 family glycosyltransferase